MQPRPRSYDADAATARLKVTKATLYAYVSRGLIASVADAADPRRRLYRAEDVERLAAKKAMGRRPERIAAATLDFGLPVLPSRITLIAEGRLFYRGRDAAALAESASFEDAARLLWDCGDIDPFADPAAAPAPGLSRPLAPAPIPRMVAALAHLDPGGGAIWQREPHRLWPGAARLLRHLAAAAAARAPSADAVHIQLARAGGLDGRGADLIRRALVLCADHELNASAFAARVVASTGASLAAAVMGGLAALSGPRHGGATERVEALFDELRAAGDMRRAVAERLARGEAAPGFGHPLYPDGDPRAHVLLSALPEEKRRQDLIEAMDRLGGARPNIDFALVALRRALGLPRGAAVALFAVARAAGWIAHALEQRGEGRLIRPRAHYVGTPPM
ncbi:MAG TPA: citrate/2-methylcitrate synthase [Stellaceae bacterium]|nr:citrate/2-methylcitrate synthase [Stellaceae bacterium]